MRSIFASFGVRPVIDLVKSSKQRTYKKPKFEIRHDTNLQKKFDEDLVKPLDKYARLK